MLTDSQFDRLKKIIANKQEELSASLHELIESFVEEIANGIHSDHKALIKAYDANIADLEDYKAFDEDPATSYLIELCTLAGLQNCISDCYAEALKEYVEKSE